MAKTYYFSVRKHAHDIELYRNTMYNTMYDMESGRIPMQREWFEKAYEFYYGPLNELYEMMFNSRDGYTVQLTGKQIALAKQIVLWASEKRTATAIRNGRYGDIQYC